MSSPAKLPYGPRPAPLPKVNPWLFVPVLYFMQFLPNGVVTSLFIPLYRSLGVDPLTIAIWISLAQLPWAFKMFWGPLVDFNSTKRRWTLAMQFCIAAALVLVASALLLPGWFALTLTTLFFIATFSATHDIACDGLYLMSLDKQRQAAFSGVMAASSRMGRLFLESVIIFLGGYLASAAFFSQQAAWAVALGICAVLYATGTLWNIFMLPRPAADVPVTDLAPGERGRNILRTLTILASGVCLYFSVSAAVEFTGYGIFRLLHGTTYDAALALRDPANVARTPEAVAAASAAAAEALAALPPPKVPLQWHMYPADIWLQLTLGLTCLALLAPLGLAIRSTVRGTPMGNAFVSFFTQRGFLAILCFVVFYRFGDVMIFVMSSPFFMDSPARGGLQIPLEQLGVIRGLAYTGGLILGGLAGGWFIAKVGLRKAFWPLVVCLHTPNLLYVWAALDNEWFIAQRLTLSNWPLWLAGALALGPLIAAVFASRRALPWLTGASAAVAAVYGGLRLGGLAPAADVLVTHWPLYPLVFVEAAGYGAGFAGYFVFLMQVAQRSKFVTSHYAIATGLGALFITFAGISAGVVYSIWGYPGVFIGACIMTIPGTLTLLFIPLDDPAQPASAP